MDISGLTAASAGISQASNQYSFSISMLKNSMGLVEDTMDTLFTNLEASMTGIGQNIDVSV